MFPPIPRQLLSETATVLACTGTDKWKEQTTASYTISRVHLQDSNAVRKTAENTEVVLRAILYVDARRSAPAFDWRSVLRTAKAAGGDVKVTVDGVTYTVETVDALPDDRGRLHHYEVGMI
jgi:hypothetical protein